MTRSLLFSMLCAANAAHAGPWSVAAEAGSSRLDSRHHDDASVDTNATYGLRVAWRLGRHWALEAGWLHADTGYRTGTAHVERDFDALLLGARVEFPLGERAFALARGGYAHNRIDTEEPRGTSVIRDDGDRGHYLGAGIGWRWNDRWRSTLELTRVYGDVAYGCKDGACATTHSSYFDGVRVGVEYAFGER